MVLTEPFWHKRFFYLDEDNSEPCFCNTAETKQQQRDDDDDANIVLSVRSRLSKRRKDQVRRGTKGGTRLRNYFIQKRSLAALFEGILMDRKNHKKVFTIEHTNILYLYRRERREMNTTILLLLLLRTRETATLFSSTFNKRWCLFAL